jgi:hypothetical protein
VMRAEKNTFGHAKAWQTSTTDTSVRHARGHQKSDAGAGPKITGRPGKDFQLPRHRQSGTPSLWVSDADLTPAFSSFIGSGRYQSCLHTTRRTLGTEPSAQQHASASSSALPP